MIAVLFYSLLGSLVGLNLVPMTDSVSPSDARRLVLARQGLASRGTFGNGLGATQKAIEHLGYVQIDTISVVARAHIHTLWNRVSVFKANDIDLLQEQGAVFEHWAHALAILPMRDYRYSLPMMQRIASSALLNSIAVLQ